LHDGIEAARRVTLKWSKGDLAAAVNKIEAWTVKACDILYDMRGLAHRDYRYDLCTDMGADPGFERLDDLVERRGIDIAFFGEDRFERPNPQLQVGELGHFGVSVAMGMTVIMGMVVGWHRKAIEMCGATNVRVTETKCRAKGAELCEYVCEWD